MPATSAWPAYFKITWWLNLYFILLLFSYIYIIVIVSCILCATTDPVDSAGSNRSRSGYSQAAVLWSLAVASWSWSDRICIVVVSLLYSLFIYIIEYHSYYVCKCYTSVHDPDPGPDRIRVHDPGLSCQSAVILILVWSWSWSCAAVLVWSSIKAWMFARDPAAESWCSNNAVHVISYPRS